jgi:hypothetical protein
VATVAPRVDRQSSMDLSRTFPLPVGALASSMPSTLDFETLEPPPMKRGNPGARRGIQAKLRRKCPFTLANTIRMTGLAVIRGATEG